MRKHTHRKVTLPMPPPGLRPRLQKSQVQDLGLVHISNLDLIAKGRGTEELLWQWCGGAYTWSFVAATLHRRDPVRYADAALAMVTQLEVCGSLIERYGRTGRVIFNGVEYQTAKNACEWMDALAAIVDAPTAVRAAHWSEERINQLAASIARRQEHVA